MTSHRAKLNEDKCFRLMRLLEATPNISQREMAKALGVSFGGINYCLNALIDKGLVKIHNFSQNQNKFGYVYLLTPSGIAEKAAQTSVFLKRKMEACQQAMESAAQDGSFVRPQPQAFEACRSESIDYAVIEHHANVAVLPFASAWSDVGSWNAVANLTPADAQGNL